MGLLVIQSFSHIYLNVKLLKQIKKRYIQKKLFNS